MQVNCKALLRLLKKNLVNSFLCETVIPKPSFTYKLCNILLSKMNLGNNISSDQTNSIAPPSEVRGIKILNRDAFSKEIHVPYVLVTPEKVKEVAKSLKPYFLKMPNLQPIQNEGKEKKSFTSSSISRGKTDRVTKNIKQIKFKKYFKDNS
ncbi:hypothetical protein CEXT_743491 [Caerostris extrusa]|uniref:Uncharacterized protein n=1 Tax=Caerostris extrusa TaxID=172846 RepID=A0AAV4NTH0_CAEEX|nr:hypothetical protein CEXT_743491 [Caerostris extrusa]